MYKIHRTIASLLFMTLITTTYAGGGMWLPHLLAALNEDEMQSMGMKMSAEDIYSVNQGSLKDAVIHFGGFCTGEIISDQGLILTNHHCGYGQIQSHSTLEANYLIDGFWAMSKEDELANPGLFVRFIDRIEDVTTVLLDGVTEDMADDERQSRIDKNREAFMKGQQTDDYHEVMVRPFFHGNQYIAFFTTSYPDVRLVGAPPESIGKFGHDTDNWVWPRHTGDFALFRVYADADGQPAEYSMDNVPLKPKHHLPVSLDGVEKGDFTMVFGFPGRTDQYLPAKAMDIRATQVNPARIALREEAMKILDAGMKSDPEVKIKYASKFARLTNYWKKWIGESGGLSRSDAVQKKLDYEANYSHRLDENEELKAKYGAVLPSLNTVYDEIANLQVAQSVHSEGFSRNIEAVNLTNILGRLVNIYENNGAEAYAQAKPRYLNYLSKQYKDHVPSLDYTVMTALVDAYIEHMPESLLTEDWRVGLQGVSSAYDGMLQTRDQAVTNWEKIEAISGDGAELSAWYKADPFVQAIAKVEEAYNAQVAQPLSELEAKRSSLMRTYMQAQMEAFPDRRFFPDANGTMRVTYGQVNGYVPRDGVSYGAQTYLHGVMEKYKPGDWEFDVPQRLIDLYDTKDYGPYADEHGMPLCFVGSNHTSGGNSGSPAIDAHGNLVGLNFDRVWEGTMSDLHYDPEICRNIMVDARYILFIVDKYAGAGHLVEEMTLVRPKR